MSKPLGIWIIFSAFFLYVYEQNLYEKQLARDLDILDGMVAAEVQEETVKLFEGKADGEHPAPPRRNGGHPHRPRPRHPQADSVAPRQTHATPG
jgi:hypothetical protein